MKNVTVNAVAAPVSAETTGILVQISVDKPAQGAVAIVLDLSDSCELGRAELDHCAQLIQVLPRRWPVWLYQLSSNQPLAQLDSYQIADFQEKRFLLSSWMENSRDSFPGPDCGSLIQPVIDSIEAARKQANLDDVTVLVLSDGELLDFNACAVPDKLRIVGVATTTDASKQDHWHRVLPDCPFYALDDRRLDREFNSATSPYYGYCEIRWELQSNQQSKALCFDTASQTFRPLAENRIKHNFAADPLVLRLPQSQSEFTDLRWTCKSLQTDSEISLQIPLDAAGFPAELRTAVQNAEARSTKTTPTILVDMTSLSEGFPALWQDVLAAHKCAETNDRWLDDKDRLLFFRESDISDEQGQSKYHAVLCLVRGELTAEPGPKSCIVIYALDRRAHPALRWPPEDRFASSQSAISAEFFFDSERSRWMVCYEGQTPEELEPFGSQRLEKLAIPEGPWRVLFSGSLAK